MVGAKLDVGVSSENILVFVYEADDIIEFM